MLFKTKIKAVSNKTTAYTLTLSILKFVITKVKLKFLILLKPIILFNIKIKILMKVIYNEIKKINFFLKVMMNYLNKDKKVLTLNFKNNLLKI